MNNPVTASFSAIAPVIQQRRTWKILGDPVHPIRFPDEMANRNNAIVKRAVAMAGLAPFHYDRAVAGVAEPWRVHLLWSPACREIALGLPEWFELKPSNKLPAMLAACGALVLVTWLPQFRGEVTDNNELSADKKLEVDDEHLLATGAVVQNLLLLLTEAGLGTYWSSGGQLNSLEMFQRFAIDPTERLAAAVFVEYPSGDGPILERLPGKNHERRSPVDKWSREIVLSKKVLS